MSIPLVRASDIAEMAGVSRAAVTQWRKRHSDFPAPKEAADTPSPMFDRTEIEQWLVDNGRGILLRRTETQGHRSIASRLMQHLQGRYAPGTAIKIACSAIVLDHLLRTASRAAIEQGPATGLDLSDIGADSLSRLLTENAEDRTPEQVIDLICAREANLQGCLLELVDRSGRLIVEDVVLESVADIVASVPAEGLAEVYDELLMMDPRALGSYTEPSAITDLFVDLLPGGAGVVLDPAVGYANLLIAVGKSQPQSTLFGVDTDSGVLAVATSRAVLRHRNVELRVGNSVAGDPFHGLEADIVVTNPPWGTHIDRDVNLADPRWVFGRPTQRDNGIWLQHAISHLAPQGRAFVLTPRRDLSASGRTKDWRDEMLRRGAIEAVIALPVGMLRPYTAIASALWILATPGSTVDPDRVFLACIAEPQGRGKQIETATVVEQYRRWRSSGTIADSDTEIVLPVRTLLEPGTGLDPETWLAKQNVVDPQQQLDEIHALAEELRRIPTERDLPLDVPLIVVERDVRAERLEAYPGVEVIRGAPVIDSRESGKSGESGSDRVGVLTPRVVRDLRAGVEPEVQFVDRVSMRRRVETRSGDILVQALTPGRTDLVSTVLTDQEAGWTLSQHFYVVRVDPEVADPGFIRTCIRSGNRPALASNPVGPSTVQINKIEVPVLPLAEQQEIGTMMTQLEHTADLAQRQANLNKKLLSSLSVAFAAHAITVAR
ncbi:N-6 DNA methylase [Rhodococcus erythropolis]|uniref:N-6 DNA methylase n=1 Tax=Rhodococcus erythropolis TaxID=1833 RepID=A0A8I0ZLS7_RHOER|nr:N-6 DNA methylase [Rhodococcus erythropolis]MBH5141859.1 N-6 DNA methylase [Rhodococcus erythropolis]